MIIYERGNINILIHNLLMLKKGKIKKFKWLLYGKRGRSVQESGMEAELLTITCSVAPKLDPSK